MNLNRETVLSDREYSIFIKEEGVAMMCSAYFGEISDERKSNWYIGSNDPYSILKSRIELPGKGHELLGRGADFFHEKIQIDWGSFAWKCKKDEIIAFLNDCKSDLPWLQKKTEDLIHSVECYIMEHKNADFAVVFIEEA